MSKTRRALMHLDLPMQLVKLIREGRVLDAVEKAYAKHDRLCALLDMWEAQYPEVAAKAPWAPYREAWKAAGRPRPDWWDVLHWHEPSMAFTPLDSESIRAAAVKNTGAVYKRRQKAKRSSGSPLSNPTG